MLLMETFVQLMELAALQILVLVPQDITVFLAVFQFATQSTVQTLVFAHTMEPVLQRIPVTVTLVTLEVSVNTICATERAQRMLQMFAQVMVLVQALISACVPMAMLDHNAQSQYVMERMPQTQTFAQVMVAVLLLTPAHVVQNGNQHNVMFQSALVLMPQIQEFVPINKDPASTQIPAHVAMVILVMLANSIFATVPTVHNLLLHVPTMEHVLLLIPALVLQIMLDHNAQPQFVSERMQQISTFAQAMVLVHHQITVLVLLSTQAQIAVSQFVMDTLQMIHVFARMVWEHVFLQILAVVEMGMEALLVLFQFASRLLAIILLYVVDMETVLHQMSANVLVLTLESSASSLHAMESILHQQLFVLTMVLV